LAYDEDVWDRIREDADRGLTPSRLAEIHKPVSRTAIIRRAKLEDWKNTRARIDARAHGKADGIEFGQTGAETEAAIGAASDERALLILKHRQQWAVIDRFQAESIRRALMSLEAEKSDEVTLLRRDADWLLGYYKRQAQSILDAQEGQRRAYGFDYRQQQEESEEDEAISERRRAILRSLEASEPPKRITR
jgi:hypothetical protein